MKGGIEVTKKILIGTTNPSKTNYFKKLLEDYEVELITLKDLKIEDEPLEFGKTPTENAMIKVKYYGQYFNNIICNDVGLYFNHLELNDPLQPGLHIRSPQNVKLNDDEMINYYSQLVASFNKDVVAYYSNGFATYANGKIQTFTEPKEISLCNYFYLTSLPSSIRHKGWPLDSLSLNKEKKYFTESKKTISLLDNENLKIYQYEQKLIRFLVQEFALKPKIIIETKRLYLRKMNQNDLPFLKKILQDKQVMLAYEHAFSDQEVLNWLNKNLIRYQKDGIGLWAVILKENDKMIGQCGITYQQYNLQQVFEIGYLFDKDYWHHGYATEAAVACKKYAFETLNVNEVYSIIRDNNIASKKVALRNGMRKVDQINKHYYGIDMPHDVYVIFKK